MSAVPPTLYVSFDLETVGGNPDDEPIVNAGFVALLEDGTEVASLNVNMHYKRGDPKTLEWWQSTPELRAAWASFQHDALAPADAMVRIRDWIASLTAGPIRYRLLLVCYPVVFDGSLLYAYWFRYLGHPTNGKGPGFTALDIRSYAAGKLQVDYQETSKDRALKPYCPAPDAFPHTHSGLDDAREQGHLLLNLMHGRKTMQ